MGALLKMVKTKKQKLEERKSINRTFKETSSMGKMQDKLTEIEYRLEELENAK